MSRLYSQRQKDADEAHRIQVKAGFLVSESRKLIARRRHGCVALLLVS